MARSSRARRRLSSRQLRSTPYPLPSYRWGPPEKEGNMKKTSTALEKRDWEDATCSVCMEFPHNAVLLLCSSHDKGCRPYMCGTSYRYSNCLDQFKKAYTKLMPSHHMSLETPPSLGSAISGWTATSEKSDLAELQCPLCRGQVKGWTVVEPAREYLNNKKRSCMQDNCPFAGTYKELRKHVRSEHPCAKPREVDPTLEQKWRTLEHESERADVISTIRSSMPGAVVLGDYVIEVNNNGGLDTDDEDVDGNGDFGGGGSRGISSRILYLLFREGARLMRLQRGGHGGASGGEEGSGHDLLPMASDVTDVAVDYRSEGDDDDEDDDDDDVASSVIGQRGGIGVPRPERRRRRRRRSQGRSVLDVS